ncbi:MAG TPA: 1-acyl-sn-glycerol-3-phosphate acyltransferase [Saprospiraceae bacterium]|nr:1-acyl-sn-glycerol-3-phosphate acyltransferase [Saprospiraceae bacterium]
MPYRNIRLHPILRLIYFFFRALAWLGAGVFYRRRLVVGSDNFRFDGPAIVVTNHPSTLMDVLNPGLPIRQEMFFLANYGLFKHPVSNWLLTRLYCIPVKRREDVAEGQERNNASAFKQSFVHLEKYGVLFIAAEGTSWMHRWVREFKTGAARIAFGAENQNKWKLDLKIIPIGLSYSAPDLFRSDVVVNCGEAVRPRDWEDAWRQNPERAVDDLTAELQRRVTGLTIHTRDEEGEQLINRLEEMLKNEQPDDLKSTFLKVKHLAETRLDDEALRSKTDRYFDDLESARLSDLGIKSCLAPNVGLQTFADTLLLIAGFLPFAVGYAFWFLPCYLPWWLNKKLDLYIGYSSTVKILGGLITFPIALWLAHKFLPGALGWPNTGMPIVLVLIALGYFAELYMDRWRRVRERFKAGRFAAANPKKFEVLAALRGEILKELD